MIQRESRAAFFGAFRWAQGHLEYMEFVGPLLTRLSVGSVFALSGIGKLGHLERTTQFFTALGIPAPEFHAVFVGSVELVCGTLLVIGLLTRFAALSLLPVMAVALLTSALPAVTSLGEALTLDETLYLAVLTWLTVSGGGKLALDALVSSLSLKNTHSLTTQHGGPTL